jgi:hypothetical protein
MSERTLTDADIDALCDKLVPKIEAKLAERFYANAGKGMFQWLVKLWQPILVALIIYGLVMAPNLPKTVAEAVAHGK